MLCHTARVFSPWVTCSVSVNLWGGRLHWQILQVAGETAHVRPPGYAESNWQEGTGQIPGAH